MDSSLHLSKSRYCCAVQCPKMLWLKENKPELFDDSALNESVLETGNEVGDLAMGLFGPFSEVPYGKPSDMIERTKELLEADTPVICEASFSYRGCFCSVDILLKASDGFELYEVKSSTSVSDIYLDDVSYQCYVLKNCGINVRKASIVHINNQYVRHGNLELNKLFSIVDVTSEADARYSKVEERLAFLRTYMLQTEEPEEQFGNQCSDPYSCGFQAHCIGELPSPNIFDIRGRFDKRMDFYNQGLVSFNDLVGKDVLSPKQMMQVDHELNDRASYIDKSAIKEYVKCLSYPLYFLDFETFMPAIPLYDNSRPYQQIPFQYSLHWVEEKGGELQHTEYLAYPGYDPRRELAERLCQDIPLNVCTTAYNMGFEKGRIRNLADLYPDLAEHLMNIHDNIRDLMIPFQKGWYYSRAMEGSYSIKYVLPALFPDDPELDYHNLEGVQNGGEAMEMFARMQKMDPDELEKSRVQLLKYCCLDTYAMVKVWQKLLESSRG